MTTSATGGAGAAAAAAPLPPLTARLRGILARPRATFSTVAAHPRWRGPLAVLTLAAVIAGTAFMSTAVGRQALVDEWERSASAFGRDVDDAGYARLGDLSRIAPWYGAGRALLLLPAAVLVAAAAVWATVGRRPPRPFALALAVAAHAAVPLALRELVAAPVNYLRESTVSAFTLGAMMPSLDAASPAARALGTLDLFVLWFAVLVAFGASVAYGRRFRTLLLGALGACAGLAALVAVVVWWMGGPA